MADAPSGARPLGTDHSIYTRIAQIDSTRIRHDLLKEWSQSVPGSWQLQSVDKDGYDMATLFEAAHLLKSTDIPVAFPTETVYGLGADATRSSAVKGIYVAKQRPSDNPLIVHVSSLDQLRGLLRPATRADDGGQSDANGYKLENTAEDLIPAIYQPLISRFWPGPLTILLPNPENSVLAPEVTAGLATFGARMPNSPIALALITIANTPLAAPSANASTKPSPTTAAHVLNDLNGRIELILDGGPCTVGVESTVVDGLTSPPTILRPGGISIENIRQCKGWEDVVIGYKDASELGTKPKAPGMKYRHYSPKAQVILYEHGSPPPVPQDLRLPNPLGIIRTKTWEPRIGLKGPFLTWAGPGEEDPSGVFTDLQFPTHCLPKLPSIPVAHTEVVLNRLIAWISTTEGDLRRPMRVEFYEIALGSDTAKIARGIFAALRELDAMGVDRILVEGIDDREEGAAAVMNRLRKAAGGTTEVADEGQDGGVKEEKEEEADGKEKGKEKETKAKPKKKTRTRTRAKKDKAKKQVVPKQILPKPTP